MYPDDSLAHNQLHTLRSDLFLQLTCLTDLDLSNNPLAAMTQVRPLQQSSSGHDPGQTSPTILWQL